MQIVASGALSESKEIFFFFDLRIFVNLFIFSYCAEYRFIFGAKIFHI